MQYTIWNLARLTQRSTAKGAAHEKEYLLTPKEEKSIVRFCETLDNLGNPLHGKSIKAFAMSLLLSHRQRQLGNRWMTCFLNRHCAITTKFSQRLDRQRDNANDPAIWNDFFRKVYYFSIYINFQLILVTVAWKTCQTAQCTTRKHIQYG
jgi:hypothetical protein